MKLGYRKELDGVRAIAALMIMFFHFCQNFASNNIVYLNIKKIATFGQTGVSLFFVLSGFLITRILLSAKTSPDYFRNFYIRRALRIFPLYYLFLVLTYFVIPFVYELPTAEFGLQIYYWIYLQDFALTFNWRSIGPNHFWSLAVEEHFYMFWPLVVFFFNTRKITITIISIIVLAFLVRIFLMKFHYGTFSFTFCRMDDLAIGASLAIFEIKNKLTAKYSGRYLLVFVLVIVPTMLIWVLYSNTGNSILIFKFLLIALSYFGLLGYILSVTNKHLLKKILRLRLFSFTGKISYGLYVYHPMCYWLFAFYFKPNSILVTLTSCFVITYIVAAASYYLFELQFLKLKVYFAYDSPSNNSVMKPVSQSYLIKK